MKCAKWLQTATSTTKLTLFHPIRSFGSLVPLVLHQKCASLRSAQQLSHLLQKIDTTGPHYIRCLKPNDKAQPNLLIPKRLAEQLRYGGVLEAVRVARSGYPVRLIHDEFFERFRALVWTNDLGWNLDGVLGGEAKQEQVSERSERAF